MPIPPASTHIHNVQQAAADSLHLGSKEAIARIVATMPKQIVVADTALGHKIQELTKAVNLAAETSIWDYVRDGSSLLIAAFSVFVAIKIVAVQRKHQQKDARLSWIRQVIVEPKLSLVLQVFGDLQQELEATNTTSLSQSDRIRITQALNSNFNKLANEFISYTDSIDNSKIPQELRTIAEEYRDDLADLVDAFDDSDATNSYRIIIDTATDRRNKFFNAMYKLSTE